MAGCGVQVHGDVGGGRDDKLKSMDDKSTCKSGLVPMCKRFAFPDLLVYFQPYILRVRMCKRAHAQERERESERGQRKKECDSIALEYQHP